MEDYAEGNYRIDPRFRDPKPTHFVSGAAFSSNKAARNKARTFFNPEEMPPIQYRSNEGKIRILENSERLVIAGRGLHEWNEDSTLNESLLNDEKYPRNILFHYFADILLRESVLCAS